MGSFRMSRLRKTFRRSEHYATVVETGTLHAETTRFLAEHFDRVISIELDETLHAEARTICDAAGYRNIELVRGDSGTLLPDVIRSLTGRTVFFLDAHWSGDAHVDWEESRWKGYGIRTAHLGDTAQPSSTEQVPLDREVKAIAEHYPSEGILYIDDTKNFDASGQGIRGKSFQGENWSHLSLDALVRPLGTRIKKTRKFRNQLILVINPLPTNLAGKISNQLAHAWNRLRSAFR